MTTDGPTFHSYQPADGHGLAHNPLNAIIAPRPIGWISSIDSQGRHNLAPYSFFNLFNYKPPIIGFCSNGWKDSVANISETGEFVWNLVTLELAERMNLTSAPFAREQDEFALARLPTRASSRVAPARVADSPVQFECHLSQIVRLTSAAGEPVDSWMVLGEVVAVHIREDMLADGVYDTVAAEPVLRGGGAGDYMVLRRDAMFSMSRPPSVEEAEQYWRSHGDA